MAARRSALLVGVNRINDGAFSNLRYAEKDCTDLFAALADPVSGIFDREEITLIPGVEATTPTVKRALRSALVTAKETFDLVLFYFSGHGFICDVGGRSRTYLGTSDVSMENIFAFPHEGLDMEFLHNEVFTATKARLVLVLLDCCHSGAIVPDNLRQKGIEPGEGSPPMATRTIHSRSEFLTSPIVSGSGRVALVACSADAVSRESSQLQNGIFTYHLLKALGGDATEPLTGEVTLDSLTGYLRHCLPPEQQPVRYGQDALRLVLSKVSSHTSVRLENRKIPQGFSASPLTNPLEAYSPLIRDLQERLTDVNSPLVGDSDEPSLQAIRTAANAEIAMILQLDPQEKQLRVIRESSAPRGEERISRVRLLEVAAAVIASEDVRKRTSHGTVVRSVAGVDPYAAVVVPVPLSNEREFILVGGMDPQSQLITDVFGTILAATLSAVRRVQPARRHLLAAALLDELKRTYGFLPRSMYNDRLALFRRRLEKTILFFQPVVFIDRHRPTIDSWEALAREVETQWTPEELFSAAELWGRKFMRELDCVFLEKTLTTFRSAVERSGIDSSQSLSINVYPQSLITAEYRETLTRMIRDGLVTAQQLIIEISEKVPIPTEHPEVPEEEALEQFKATLEDYATELQVTFSIDDFGQRHASISRLARLNPVHVKVDRDVLLHDFGDKVIRFVLRVTQTKRLHPVKCVIEGFDVDSRLNLGALYDLGVRYVQGFLLRKPSAELQGLGPETIRLIQSLLDGE